MLPIAKTFWTMLVGLWLSGCLYDLDLEGKRCDSDHPCPQGYSCLPGGADLICLRFGTDGGSTDGADGGDQSVCTEDATRCSPDQSALETCVQSDWVATDCPAGQYCLDPEANAPGCVDECANSAACPTDTWCDPDSQHCEPKGACQNPGVDRCSANEVIRCDPESGYDLTVATCAPATQYCDPFNPACKEYCDDDLACPAWPAASCDSTSRKCVSLSLCASDQDCAIGRQCVEAGGACATIPAQDGTLPGGGPPDLDCYIGEPTAASPEPETCNLEGRVVEFYNGRERAETVGLAVRIHLEADVLDGVTSKPIVSTTAFDDAGYGQYTLADVPTNTPLVLEVQGRSGGAGFDFASMYTFGIYLRADDCSSGTISLAAPAIFQLNYDAYAQAANQVVPNPDRGLLFGQLRDCNGVKLVGATGGLSMGHELVYYLVSGIPDPAAEATDLSGFFAAANTIPIRGVAAALVRQQVVLLSLRIKPVRVFPAAASLVLFDKPLAPR